MVDTNLDKYTIIIEEQDNYTIELNEQGPQGLRGPQGEVGPVGPQGEAATISVGTVTTGEEGSNATVTNSGTQLNAVLDFEIPRGDKGEAATIVVGSTTTGEPGTEADVVNSGDENMAILDFTIPRGSKGDKGDTGPQGPQGVQGPKGDKGDTGYGIPIGGTTGQILSKKSDTNYDIEWIDNNPSSLEVMYDKDNKAIKFIDSTNIVTFTINPTPSDATVVITSGTCEQVGNSITVPKNSLVEYTVSKEGMVTKSGYVNVVDDTNIDIKLSLSPVNLTINNTTYSETTLTYNDGSEENKTSSLGANESVTINVVPNTIIKATDSYGIYFIVANTSGSIDYTPYSPGGAGGGVWNYRGIGVSTIESSDNIVFTYNNGASLTGSGSISKYTNNSGQTTTPLKLTTTSSTNTYTFEYAPTPAESYSYTGMFALIDTNGVGSIVGSSSSGGGIWGEV